MTDINQDQQHSQEAVQTLDKIKPINIVDELKSSYLDYAMSVIMGRALPDARDGFKPVHRRVLYSMHLDGHTPDKPFVKSAEIVGKVMGLFHPHGDSAIYDTLVRMAQDFSLRYPLAQGQGNFGGRGEESPAAMRYTEARMSKMALEMLTDIDKETVDFMPNYSNKTFEPLVLPTRIPNLLINGSSGIAVGMATNIPPHNLSEVIDGCVAYVDNPDISIDELMKHIPAPDFPTGGVILGRSGIREAYHTGRGKLWLRSVYEVNESSRIKKINITELPYQVSYNRVVERINELIKSGEVQGITEVLNLSKNNINIQLSIHKDYDPQIIMNQLFAKTPLQTSVSFNMVALHNGKPQTLNLKQFIAIFVDFRREVITRRCVYELRKARERSHILEALAVALANIDEIISIIRKSPRRKDAQDALMQRGWSYDVLKAMVQSFGDKYDASIARPDFLEKQFGINEATQEYYFSHEQAKAILDMPLARLTGLEQQAISEEYSGLLATIVDLLDILMRSERLTQVLRDELLDVKARNATRHNNFDARLSQISSEAVSVDDESFVNKEDVVITFSRDSYIKYQQLNEYRSQNRGGRGKQAAKMKNDDLIDQLVIGTTTDTLLCFTNLGRVFQIKVYRLPHATRNARGRPINNFINLQDDEKITNLIILDENATDNLDDKFLFFATEQGQVKRTPLAPFTKIRAKGLKAITLAGIDLGEQDGDDAADAEAQELEVNLLDGSLEVEDVDLETADNDVADSDAGDDTDAADDSEVIVVDDAPLGPDRLASVVVTKEDDIVYLISAFGRVQAFPVNKVRVQGRTSRGVRGMRLASNSDKIVAVIIPQNDDPICTVTERGLGKRVKLSLIPVRNNRGARGVILHKLTARTGTRVVAASQVAPIDQVAIMTSSGMLVRINGDVISEQGRGSSGVRLVNLVGDDLVASMERIINGQEIEREDLLAQQAMLEAENAPYASEAIAEQSGVVAVADQEDASIDPPDVVVDATDADDTADDTTM